MKRLIYKEGNLLLSNDVQVIAHQANCQNTFGSGIARSIREMYPEAYLADTHAAGKKTNTLGNYSYANIPDFRTKENKSSITRIYNLYGQDLYGKGVRQTNYDALYNALEGMAKSLEPTESDKMMFDFDRRPKIGFPYQMGSFRGGGSWDIVSRLIEVAFKDYPNDVIIYRLDAN